MLDEINDGEEAYITEHPEAAGKIVEEKAVRLLNYSLLIIQNADSMEKTEVNNKENETKDNETKDNEAKDNEIKRKWNQSKENDIKDNDIKDNEIKDNEAKDIKPQNPVEREENGMSLFIIMKYGFIKSIKELIFLFMR